MPITGKGFFIWKIQDAELGDAHQITQTAQTAGLTHVLIKIADGSYPYNIDRTTGADLITPVVDQLHDAGLKVWGWHYVYGNSPISEAAIAIKRINQLALDGYIVDAEAEYKEAGKPQAARTFMQAVRKQLPKLPIGLSSFRFPSFHPQFPWQSFLEFCDLIMPQVYWEQAKNPGAQLRRCVREFQNLSPSLPVIPTGPVYSVGSWQPTPAELAEFFETCYTLGLPAANFFSWDECRSRLPELWDVIGAYKWTTQQAEADIIDQYLTALNSRDVNRVAAIYAPYAIHITSARTIQTQGAIRAWYSSLLRDILPGATFQTTGRKNHGSTIQFNWVAESRRGRVTDGNDTIGLLDGKIAYHYSSFSVTPK